MTYTYKLSRRLAISRHAGMLAASLTIAACAGETTGPDSTTTTTEIANAYGLRVVPGTVTIETGQPVRFRGETGDGSVVFKAGLTWEASGGMINSDGTFTASHPGTYKVVARGRGRGRQKPDTSIVIVVPPQPNLQALVITPDSVSLLGGESHTFLVAGRLSDGSSVAIGANWTATGGTVDAGGAYKAGNVGGRFQVIATRDDLADTAVVDVTVPTTTPEPGPHPEPEPEPPPAPTLAKLVLKPATVTVVTNTTKQFDAFGRTSTGDSVPLQQVKYTATGGTVSATGLYSAGGTVGTYRVIASAEGFADTALVTLTRPPVSGGTVGLPFGPSQQLGRTGGVVAPFTMTSDAHTADGIVNRITAARNGRYTLLLNMTGGHHDNYMSTINGVYQFDIAKWRAKMDTYNTAAIKQAVADGVRDGVIVGNLVMDEPQVTGGGDGNTWGPRGTMTKLVVDGMCNYVKQMFPTMAVGVFHQHNTFEPEKSYRVCEFIVDQYNHRRGDVDTFREDGLALARRDGHTVMFSLNILNGGAQDHDGTWDCTGPGQGGKGTFAPNCRMTADQVREWGINLGSAGCGLFMWRYDAEFVANPANQRAFAEVGARLASMPSKSCHRP